MPLNGSRAPYFFALDRRSLAAARHWRNGGRRVRHDCKSRVQKITQSESG